MTIERRYFDTSALVKVLVRRERDSEVASELFYSGARQYTSRLTRPETLSALSRRVRDRSLSAAELSEALSLFAQAWTRLNVTPVQDDYLDYAAELTLRYPLSGADAVHLATAMDMRGYGDVTFVTWDRQQAAAARALGLDVQPSASA